LAQLVGQGPLKSRGISGCLILRQSKKPPSQFNPDLLALRSETNLKRKNRGSEASASGNSKEHLRIAPGAVTIPEAVG